MTCHPSSYEGRQSRSRAVMVFFRRLSRTPEDGGGPPGRTFLHNTGALASGTVEVPSLGQKLSRVGNWEAALEGRRSTEPNCIQILAPYTLNKWLNFSMLPCLDLLNSSTKARHGSADL